MGGWAGEGPGGPWRRPLAAERLRTELSSGGARGSPASPVTGRPILPALGWQQFKIKCYLIILIILRLACHLPLEGSLLKGNKDPAGGGGGTGVQESPAGGPLGQAAPAAPPGKITKGGGGQARRESPPPTATTAQRAAVARQMQRRGCPAPRPQPCCKRQKLKAAPWIQASPEPLPPGVPPDRWGKVPLCLDWEPRCSRLLQALDQMCPRGLTFPSGKCK